MSLSSSESWSFMLILSLPSCHVIFVISPSHHQNPEVLLLILSLSTCHVTFVISFSHPHCHDHQGCNRKCFLSKSESKVRNNRGCNWSWLSPFSPFTPWCIYNSTSSSSSFNKRPKNKDTTNHHCRSIYHHHSKAQNKQTPTNITTTTMIVEPTQEQHHKQWHDPYHLHCHDPAYPRAILWWSRTFWTAAAMPMAAIIIMFAPVKYSWVFIFSYLEGNFRHFKIAP